LVDWSSSYAVSGWRFAYSSSLCSCRYRVTSEDDRRPERLSVVVEHRQHLDVEDDALRPRPVQLHPADPVPAAVQVRLLDVAA
jgi:hypothetical protein